MSVCGPSNAIPACVATPSVGFGSSNHGIGSSFGLGSHGFSLGSSGFGLGFSGYGLGSIGYVLASEDTVSGASLGVLHGLHPSAINQLPPREIKIQPPSVIVVFPATFLATNLVPLRVGGYSPFSSSSNSGFGFGEYLL